MRLQAIAMQYDPCPLSTHCLNPDARRTAELCGPEKQFESSRTCGRGEQFEAPVPQGDGRRHQQTSQRPEAITDITNNLQCDRIATMLLEAARCLGQTDGPSSSRSALGKMFVLSGCRIKELRRSLTCGTKAPRC